MRPGPHPFATNDTYAAGPDVGSNSKTETLAVHRGDGYYRGYRPGPDIFNWQLNRNALVQQFAASMMASNYDLQQSSAVLAGFVMRCTCNFLWPGVACGTMIEAFFEDGAGNIEVRAGYQGKGWVTGVAALAAGAGVITTMDADSNGSTWRVLVCDSTVADRVYSTNALGLGAWPLRAATMVPAAGLLGWQAVGCDRNTAGGATVLWLIGDDGVAGTVAPTVYESTDAINWTPNATFPVDAPMVGEEIRLIGHTCHGAGALGPDDPGNPSWLVLTDTYAIVSADGSSWGRYAHGFATVPQRRTAAYSRGSRRWVAVGTNAAAPGDIEYSDDNGATWTNIAGALPNIAATPTEIVCDGYGTFVVSSGTNILWVSSDEGLTWKEISLQGLMTPGFADALIEVGWSETFGWSAGGTAPTFFCGCFFTPGGGGLHEAIRSLVY